MLRYIVVVVALLGSAFLARAEPAQNLILVTIDGLRWQEVFGGFDPALATKEAGGVSYPPGLANEHRRDSAEASRATIMPFLWEVVAAKGRVYGDRGVKNVARVTNVICQSYPGYAELLCGHVDVRIRGNAPIPNPNVTVLEWLHGRPGYADRVAAYGAWGRMKPILNPGRSRLPVFAGWGPIEPRYGVPLTEREKVLNDLLARSTRIWPEEPPDAIVMEAAMEHFVRHKPRVFYVALGEPDEWAHGRRYDLYLQSTKRCDEFVRRLWEAAQAMPEYAGKTALVITTDHGRGATPADWTDHGRGTPGSDGWWLAMTGPGVEAKGVVGEGEVTQSQTAATLAALLGEDWCAAEPRAAKSIVPVRKNEK